MAYTSTTERSNSAIAVVHVSSYGIDDPKSIADTRSGVANVIRGIRPLMSPGPYTIAGRRITTGNGSV